MEEFVVPISANLVPVNNISSREQTAAEFVNPAPAKSDALAAELAVSHVNIYGSAPAWVSIIYFMAFILGAGFVWYFYGNPF